MHPSAALHPSTAADPRPAGWSGRRRDVVYWLVSLTVLAETAAGIQWDFARNPAVVEALNTIRFPDYRNAGPVRTGL